MAKYPSAATESTIIRATSNPHSSQEAVKSGVWVTGYIVGWADVSAAPYAINAETAHFDASATMATNILVASSADVKDVSKCIGVQLPTGEIRSALNLQANPGFIRFLTHCFL